MVDIIKFLTSPGGIFASLMAILGLIATVFGILQPFIDRRRECRESKAQLHIADLQLSPLSRSSNSYEMRFVITNVGQSKAIMRRLLIRVLNRIASTATVATVPEAPLRVHVHRVELIEGNNLYDLRSRAFGTALPPLSFEEAEAEGFVVKIVSREHMQYELRVEAEWYDAKDPEQLQTLRSGSVLLTFPRRVAHGHDTTAPDPPKAS